MANTSTAQLLELVRSRQLGFGKAAELADISIAEFLSLMGKHQITPFDYDEDELARELQPITPTSESEGSGALTPTERPSRN